jgi:hypothetical protein
VSRAHLTSQTITDSHSYFTSVFVSLGVFLFGYDQGVMSGIITCARPEHPSVLEYI